MKLKQAEQLLKTLHLELSGEDIKLKQTSARDRSHGYQF